jgi:hypothetical protein
MSGEKIQLIIIVVLIALLAVSIILNVTGVARVPLPA